MRCLCAPVTVITGWTTCMSFKFIKLHENWFRMVCKTSHEAASMWTWRLWRAVAAVTLAVCTPQSHGQRRCLPAFSVWTRTKLFLLWMYLLHQCFVLFLLKAPPCLAQKRRSHPGHETDLRAGTLCQEPVFPTLSLHSLSKRSCSWVWSHQAVQEPDVPPSVGPRCAQPASAVLAVLISHVCTFFDL